MKRLRSETREQHEALESLLALGKSSLDSAAYLHTLKVFYGFYEVWEAQALAAASPRLRLVVLARRKLPLLEADLAALHQASVVANSPASALSVDPAWLPSLHEEASLLGSMYVVEGSTLGGQIISRQLEARLGMRDGHGYSFFQSYGRAVGQQWKDFSALIEAMPVTAGDALVAAACQTFAAFHQWFELHQEAPAWRS